jgi:glycosyltransferase involved in cell wall biosynthesis
LRGRTGSTGVVHAVVGPVRHGVVRHATALLGTPALAADGVYRATEPEGLIGLPQRWESLYGRRPELLHLHLTDHLLAPDAARCAELVLALSRQCPISLTLHDLPQRADGEGRYERRRAAYRAMADAAVGVIVASEHERCLLLACLPAARSACLAQRVEVVPLPLEVAGADDRGSRRLPGQSVPGPSVPGVDLVVFGYLYPGKGHLEVIEAAALLAADGPGTRGAPARTPGVRALGQASVGHEGLVAEHRERAGQLGVRFEVSGHVADHRVDALLRGAGVPIAPRRDVSASGSIGSWLRVGRRPLAPSGPYTDDLEARCPGALFRYGPCTSLPTLADAAGAALRDPGLTWLSADVRLGPGTARCGELLAAHLHRWAARVRQVLP